VLKLEDFAGRVGQTFTATADGGRALTLTLRVAEPLPAAPRAPRQDPFRLEFTDATQDHVPQQTLAVEHPEIGPFPLFVVPLGPSPDGMLYEAIFS
jgi:hypothetical protein